MKSFFILVTDPTTYRVFDDEMYEVLNNIFIFIFGDIIGIYYYSW